MHLTLKHETTRPAAGNSLAQQARFDAFLDTFNTERPHEALGHKDPGRALHPLAARLRRPARARISLPRPRHHRRPQRHHWPHGRAVIISTVFEGQKLGLREVENDVWLVSFMHYDLGYIDLEARTLQTIDTPFGSRVSPMLPVRTVTCVRAGQPS